MGDSDSDYVGYSSKKPRSGVLVIAPKGEMAQWTVWMTIQVARLC